MKLNGVEITQEVIDRFESKIFVVTEGDYIGCYETTYAKDDDTYSKLAIKHKSFRVHRLMYHIHHPDEDIDEKIICHRCDNPACVNIDHLFSGTTQDNVDDKIKKGRQPRGNKHGMSKLTDGNIVEMMNNILSGLLTSYKAITKQYNISIPVVSNIINQNLWTHITKDYDMVKVKSLLGNHLGSKNPAAAFNEDQVRDIRLRRINGESSFILANFYHVHYDTIRKIVNGKTYQDVV